MISFQESTQFLASFSGTAEESPFVIVTEQPHELRETVEAAFGCVDWYLYPPVLEAAAG